MAALAARKDGVTRVRAYIPGIAGARPAPRASCPASCPARVLPCAPEGPACALRGRSSRRAAGGLTAALISPCCAWPAEPVAAFRVHADGGLKQRMEEWRGPNHYTSGLRNLLQRHFKKVTTGEWFSSGAVLVHTPVANSVERTWGRGARQPHPKWDNVTWEEVSSSPRPDPPHILCWCPLSSPRSVMLTRGPAAPSRRHRCTCPPSLRRERPQALLRTRRQRQPIHTTTRHQQTSQRSRKVRVSRRPHRIRLPCTSNCQVRRPSTRLLWHQ